MASSRRLLQAAAALSQCLTDRSVPHAFHGAITATVLGSGVDCEAITCIVETGHNHVHPFRRVKEAVSGNEDFKTTNATWGNRFFVTYLQLIPAITIEILPAGEEGPRKINNSTAMYIRGVPFLNITEFTRAKLKAWIIRRHEQDASDLVFILTRFWHRININRIPEPDMDKFVQVHTAARKSWESVRAIYNSEEDPSSYPEKY